VTRCLMGVSSETECCDSVARNVSFRFDVAWSGDQQMRVLGILVLAIALAGCTGDRVKQGQSIGAAPPLILTA
jgi:hypothetical protein